MCRKYGTYEPTDRIYINLCSPCIQILISNKNDRLMHIYTYKMMKKKIL